MLNSIQSCLKEEVVTLISDDNNWNIEEIVNICKICNGSIDDENCFSLSKNVGNDIWIMNFHFECAVKNEFIIEFKENNTQGWIP